MKATHAALTPIETAECEAAPAATDTLTCASAAEAGGLTARYVEVADIDHLLRTGTIRYVLAIAWVR